MQVSGVVDLALNPTGSVQQLTFRVASFNANLSNAYVTGLTFTQPPASMVAGASSSTQPSAVSSTAVPVTRAVSSSSGVGHRRLLQVGDSSSTAAPFNSGGQSSSSGALSSSGGQQLSSSLLSSAALLSSSGAQTGTANDSASSLQNDTAVTSNDLFTWLQQPFDASLVISILTQDIVTLIDLQMTAVGVAPIDPSQPDNPSGVSTSQVNITSLGVGLIFF